MRTDLTSKLLRLGGFNPETLQIQSNETTFHTLYYPMIGIYSTLRPKTLIPTTSLVLK